MDCPRLQELVGDRTAACQAERVTHTRVKVEEGKSSFILENEQQKTIYRVKIDGGLITGAETAKCDWLLVCCDHPVAWLVELKGKKIIHAAEQILATLSQLEPEWKKTTVHGRIVPTKQPTAAIIKNDAKILELRRALRRYNGSLEIGNRGKWIERL